MEAQTLRSMGVEYNAETGVITRRGIPVCAKRGNGYISLNIAGTQMYAHRVAWLFVHGYLPSGDIDHINRDKKDNRICNLREASRSENQRNHPLTPANTSGYKGVRRNKKSMKWVAFMRINKKQTHLGSFSNLEDALAARRKAEDRHCGQFAYREAA